MCRKAPPVLQFYEDYASLFEEKIGLELGGPSGIFFSAGLCPVYACAARIDNCNFSVETVWEGNMAGRDSFQFDKLRNAGKQYFVEATDLQVAQSSSYDFVLSSHMLEHSANPLKALQEWKRVLKPNGALLLVLPHKDATFDHQRPVTSLRHLIQDFDQEIGEDDLTHLPEILSLHDLAMDPSAGAVENFKLRSQRNVENRCLHHHVFDTRLAAEMVDLMRYQIRAIATGETLHIAILAVNSPGEIDNALFLSSDAGYRHSSPFPSDKP